MTLSLAPVILSAASALGLQPIPHPDLAEFQPAVREVLEPAIRHFEAEVADAQGEELATLYGNLGMHYQAQSLNEPAEVAYIGALQLMPEDFAWNYYLAFLYEETGRLELAMDRYGSAIALQSGYGPARIRLGRVALDADRADIAERQFRAVLAEDPADAAALAGLGQITAEQGRHAEALQLYDRALEQQPGADQLHYLRALSLRSLGRTEEAQVAIQQRGERIPFTPDPMLALMTARARGSEPFVTRAVQAINLGNRDAALNALSIAIAINPMDLDARVTMARLLAEQGQLDGALVVLREVLAEDPEHQLGNANMGDLLSRAGRYEEAVPYLSTAAMRDGSAELVVLLADALMLSDRYLEAATVYLELGTLPREPNSTAPDPYYFAGIAYSAGGSCQQATDAFSVAFGRSPPNPLLLQAMVRSAATCAQSMQAQRQQSLQMAEALYNNFPGQHTSETYAMALAANGMYQDAVDLQGQAIFEALRDGQLETNPQLRENMLRYEAGENAERAWPAGHPIFDSTLSEAQASAAEDEGDTG